MIKSENTNDPSEARNKALSSPLFRLVQATWRYFDEEFTSPDSPHEEDIVRNVLWSIENIKGGEKGPTVSCLDLRRDIVDLFRDKYASGIVEPLSNRVCAYVLSCLDCAFLYSHRNDIYRLCTISENSIKEQFKCKILECKERIKNGILQSGLTSELGEWCADHLLNDVFLTDEEAEWTENRDSEFMLQDEEESTNVDKGSEDNSTNPKNVESPLTQYVMLADKVDTIMVCLRRLVGSQSTPKEQLAPIKSAMEYSPRLLSNDITLDAINNEFGLNISDATFGNWIRGHRGYKYDENEFTVYWTIFDDQIMAKNVKSNS